MCRITEFRTLFELQLSPHVTTQEKRIQEYEACSYFKLPVLLPACPCCLGVRCRRAVQRVFTVAGCWPGWGRGHGRPKHRGMYRYLLNAISGTLRHREEVISDERSRDQPTTSFVSMRLVLRDVRFFGPGMFAEHLQLDLSCCNSLKGSQLLMSCCAGWRRIEARGRMALRCLQYFGFAIIQAHPRLSVASPCASSMALSPEGGVAVWGRACCRCTLSRR